MFIFLILVDVCLPLVSPANGNVVVSGLTLGSQATYSCVAGYELVGTAVRECQVDGIWTGSAPSCRRKLTQNVDLQLCVCALKCHVSTSFLCCPVSVYNPRVFYYVSVA